MKRYLFIIILIFFACDRIDQELTSYPNDKQFGPDNWSYGSGDSKVKLSLDIKLSYKSDKQCYYNVKLTIDKNEKLPGRYLFLRFLDENGMILKEFAPGWTVNDTRTVLDNGFVWRGKFEMVEGLFKEIKKYEFYFQNG